MRGRRGFALVLTLIVTTLLIAVVTEFIREVYVETTLRRSYRDGEQAVLMAESGISGGVRLLQTVMAERPAYTSLNDAWKAVPLHLEDERGVVDVVIDEESGKLNLNLVAAPDGDYDKFHAKVLARILKRLKLSSDLVQTLADWIDENEMPNPSGAETAWYQRQKPPYLPRNGLLKSLQELRLVRGYTEEIFTALRPSVTVYADDASDQVAPININTAPPEVLASLHDMMTEERVKRIIAYRKSAPFKNISDLGNVEGMKQISGDLSSSQITVKGLVYRITGTARIGETARTIEAVVRMGGTRPEFLYWREY